jgi:hypothetical protein
VVIVGFVDDLKQAVLLGGPVAKAVSILRFSSDAEWSSSSMHTARRILRHKPD